MESVLEKELIELKKRLARILRVRDNKTCADCPEKRPTWISYIQPQQSFALGSKVLASFICTKCAGMHEKMGTDVCYVRNVGHDEFDKDEIDFAEYSGNKVVNEIFEGHLQKATTNQVSIKPLLGADEAKRERFIRQKYVELYFYQKRAHYKHINEMKDTFVKLRKLQKLDKDQQPTGKKARKRLSTYLNSSLQDSLLSQCSTTVSNTVSTPDSNNDNEHEKVARDQESKGKQQKERKGLTRGRSRSKIRGKNSVSELDVRQDSRVRNRSMSKNRRGKSEDRRRTGERPRSKSEERRGSGESRTHARPRSLSRLGKSHAEESRRSGLCASPEGSSSELDMRQEAEKRSRSLSRARRGRSNGRRGKSANGNRPIKSDQNGPNSQNGNRDRERSKSRVRSLSRGKAAEIREKGQESAKLRRPRSRSTNRTAEMRRSTRTSDAEQNDEVTSQEEKDKEHQSTNEESPRHSSILNSSNSSNLLAAIYSDHASLTEEHNTMKREQSKTDGEELSRKQSGRDLLANSSEDAMGTRPLDHFATPLRDGKPKVTGTPLRNARRKSGKLGQQATDDVKAEENIDKESHDDGFKLMDSISNRYLNASWKSAGSFDKSAKKKGADLFNNNRRARRVSECMETGTNQRESRKSEILASKTRLGARTGSLEFENGTPPTPSRSPIQRSKSNDLWDSSSPKNRRASIRTRNSLLQSKGIFADQTSPSAHKNKALMEEWKKMKNENDNVFVAFDEGFSQFKRK
eukprot:CAMPEP_0172402176 /NCGR_PEP_ID=MMETSP1061-20121228/53609_1 /TAXON_ID=37318 /ORGANISM="Pseudo-nitzschia pungens, Strain cf. pungens" /LENGTH=747 /DNA_ID=CAMNT_0013136079 /DNA_START=196 /DNA_END=2439 /DNA_ORIENTATION=-